MEIAKIEFPPKLILYCLFDLNIPSTDTLIQVFLTPFLDYKYDLSPGCPYSKIWALQFILHAIPVCEHNSIPTYWKNLQISLPYYLFDLECSLSPSHHT